MPQRFLKNNLPLLLIVFVIALVSWKKEQAAEPKIQSLDTIPKEKKIQSFDEALQELDKGQAEMEKALKNLKVPPPPTPPAPPTIDLEKMKADIEKSIKEIDVEKIKADVQRSIKQVDVAKIKADVEASIAKIDWDKMKAELEKVKNIELPKVEAQLKELKPQIEKSMQEARKGIEKARKELEGYKSFVDNLDKDGLIHKNEQYTIQYKNGVLIINGKTAPTQVYNKYKAFLEEHQNFILKKDKDGLNINKDEE